MGVVTPKRWVAHAVRRNAIKRQVYAVSSAYQAQLPAAAHVVRIHRAFNKQRFVSATSDALKAQLRQELQQLFAKALAVLPQARDTQTGSFEGAKQGG